MPTITASHRRAQSVSIEYVVVFAIILALLFAAIAFLTFGADSCQNALNSGNASGCVTAFGGQPAGSPGPSAGGGDGGPAPTPGVELLTSTRGSTSWPDAALTITVPATAQVGVPFDVVVSGANIPAGSDNQIGLWAYSNTNSCDWSHAFDVPASGDGIHAVVLVNGAPLSDGGNFSSMTVSVVLPTAGEWKWESQISNTTGGYANSQPWDLSPDSSCLDAPITVASGGGGPVPTPTPAPTATPAPTPTASPATASIGTLSGLSLTNDLQRFFDCPGGVFGNDCNTPIANDGSATVSVVQTTLHLAVVPADGDVVLFLYKKASDGGLTPMNGTNVNLAPDLLAGTYLASSTTFTCAELASGTTLYATAQAYFGPGRIVDANTVTLTAELAPTACQ